MERSTFAQIGAGNWGRNLLRNFSSLEQVRMKMVCDLNPAGVHSVLGLAHETVVTTRVEDVLHDPEIDAVVIATLPATHFELARECLASGKHVFVEKPLTQRAVEAQELVRLAADRHRVLMVGHLLEYHPAYLKVKELVDSGELGDINYIYSTRVNLGVIRNHENALWSLAPHDVSVALMLMGEAPETVSACGQSYLRQEIEDVVFAALRFAGNRMVHLHVSWLDPHKIRKLTVVGTKRMAVLDDMAASEKIRIYDKGVERPGNFVGYDETLSVRNGDIHIPNIRMQEPLRYECQHFVDCILQGKVPRSDGVDGLRVVQVLEAAQRSLRLGGAPVECAPGFPVTLEATGIGGNGNGNGAARTLKPQLTTAA